MNMDWNVNRRDFLKSTGKTAIAIGGASGIQSLLNGCVSQIKPFKEEAPVIYPKLNGQKIQSPENGSYIGFHGCWEDSAENFRVKEPESIFRAYESFMGHVPKILLNYSHRSDGAMRYRPDFFDQTHNYGVIPYDFLSINYGIHYYGNFKKLFNNKSFDELIIRYAKHVADNKIPMFITTMRIPNGRAFKWCRDPQRFKAMWKHIWQIFEDVGANDYATWVWSVATPETYCGSIGNPNAYYPGDIYVDWIGLMVYSRRMVSCTGSSSLYQLCAETYRNMRRSHPEKPVMLSEFARSRGTSQGQWIGKAFNSIKELQGIKAAVYWNSADLKMNDDLTLNKESREVYRENMKNPYFIGANSA